MRTRASRSKVVTAGGILIVLVWAAFAVPTPAHAGVITKNWRVQPTGTVTSAGPVIVNGSGSFDAYPLKLDTVALTIDGTLVPRAAYTATTPFTRNLYLYYAPSPVLADGPHTFRVQIADTLGRMSAHQWSATVAQAPSASWVSPEPGAEDFDGRPAITLALSDNTPTTTLTVAGEVREGSATGAVAATFGGTGLVAGSHDFALTAELAPGTYYLTATVTDAAGNTRTLAGSAARSFTVVSVPVMTLAPASCLDAGCHTGANHPATGMPCADCHVKVYHEYGECQDCHNGHDGPVTVTGIFGDCTVCHNSAQASVARHTAASVTGSHGSSCGGCHTESLLGRHSYVPAGSAYATQCDLCHASTDPAVVASIAAGDTSCGACHAGEQGVDYHTAMSAAHTSPTTVSCFGAGCHDVSRSLPSVHANYAGSGTVNPEYADSCALCHRNPAIDTATSGARCTPACHSGTTHAGLAAGHAITSASASCTTVCHPGDLNTTHGFTGANWERCGICHADPANGTKTADCASCHSSADHETVHATTDVGCAGSTCHSGATLTSLHINASTTLTCDSCHDSTEPDVVAAIAGRDKSCAACHDASAPHGDDVLVHTGTLGAGVVPMGAGADDPDHGPGWSYYVECSLCHASNIAAVHVNQCALCHSGADPASSIGVWNRTCQQSDCHPSIHTSMAPDHNGAYWGSSTSCDSCHSGYPDWPGEPDCLACH